MNQASRPPILHIFLFILILFVRSTNSLIGNTLPILASISRMTPVVVAMGGILAVPPMADCACHGKIGCASRGRLCLSWQNFAVLSCHERPIAMSGPEHI